MVDELTQHRLDKLERFRERGDEPYKYDFDRTMTIGEARSALEAKEVDVPEDAEEKTAIENVALAGRMIASRGQGKVTFADISDEFGKIQVFLKKNTLGDESYDALKDLDIGDFIGVHGTVKRTNKGELTLFAEEWVLLTKTIRALPEKYHGLTDVETRYRQRYLDMISNPEVLDTFKARIKMVSAMRRALEDDGYLEVETPMMHPIPGGATARPFITHHNTYDRDLYMRVAPELYLKKLIVGGFDKVFEINRCFRNEGVDTKHNPEFTSMELYKAYEDFEGLMDETEALFKRTIEGTLGTLTFDYQGETIDCSGDWKRMTLFDAIREYAGVDLEQTRDKTEAAALAKGIGVDCDATMGYGKIVDEVFSDRVQPKLVQPTFLYDYPIELSPLAKKKRGNPALTERFQAIIGTMELCNAFSELNDPIDQRERFEGQATLREAGDDEAQPLDEDFIAALEIGMPPTAGLGIGIDRLAMLLTDSASIREVIMFPQLRTIQ